MIIWITNDQNHIPVRIESPIAVGSIKVDLMQYENFKYSVTALHQDEVIIFQQFYIDGNNKLTL